MSELSKREREERALEALIVAQICQQADPTNVDELPELTSEDRAAMEALGTDLIHRLWDSVSEDDVPTTFFEEEEPECVSDEAFAGMNRGDELDIESSETIAKRRKEVLERLRQKKNAERRKDD